MKGLGEYSVADIMTLDPLVIVASEPMRHALEMFESNRVAAIPVIDKSKKVVGILSLADLVPLMREIQADLSALWKSDDESRDYLLSMLRDESGDALVSEIMTAPVETIRSSDNLIIAAQLMARQQFKHLPVVDSQNHAVGMLSSTDFVRAIADLGALMTS